jgi:translation elongation factor EF-4
MNDNSTNPARLIYAIEILLSQLDAALPPELMEGDSRTDFLKKRISRFKDQTSRLKSVLSKHQDVTRRKRMLNKQNKENTRRMKHGELLNCAKAKLIKP